MAKYEPTIDFEEFAEIAHERGMVAKECHETHWQLGNGDTLLVDFWPTARKYRQRNADRTSRGDFGDALNAAYSLLNPVKKSNINWKPGPAPSPESPLPTSVVVQLARLEKIASLASAYIRNDTTRLCDMEIDQAKAALGLIVALDEAGIGLELDIPF